MALYIERSVKVTQTGVNVCLLIRLDKRVNELLNAFKTLLCLQLFQFESSRLAHKGLFQHTFPLFNLSSVFPVALFHSCFDKTCMCKHLPE